MSQQERILQAVMRSVRSRDAYAEKQVKRMLKALQQAETSVKAELVRIRERSIISKGLEVRQAQLKGIQKEIDVITRDLRKEMSLVARRSMKDAYRKSFDDVVNEWVDMGVPSYSGLSHLERVKLAKDVFSLIDTKALDFLVNYELQLLGNVTRELAEGIKNHITVGLIQGESIAKISRNIGWIITDPDEFRRAGKTVFKTAQHRTETIVRTETLRAYNQGRNKFYQQVGVVYVMWLAVGDKRTCPECRELDGKRFKLDKAPPIPLHPACRCALIADPDNLGLEGESSSQASADNETQPSVLTPEEIDRRAREKRSEKQKIGRLVKAGEFEKLTLEQLQEVAKEWDVSIYRTKEDFVRILAPLEPKVDWDNIKGVELTKLIKKHKISSRKSKAELVQLLKNKWAVRELG